MKIFFTALASAAATFAVVATTGGASSARQASTFTLHRGQSVYLSGLDIVCSYQRAPEGRYVNCNRASTQTEQGVYAANATLGAAQLEIHAAGLGGKDFSVNRRP